MHRNPRILLPGPGPRNLHFISILTGEKNTLRGTHLVQMSQREREVIKCSSGAIPSPLSPFLALVSYPPQCHNQDQQNQQITYIFQKKEANF